MDTTYKVLLLGNTGVGKTTWLESSSKVQLHDMRNSISLSTNKGDVRLDIIEVNSPTIGLPWMRKHAVIGMYRKGNIEDVFKLHELTDTYRGNTPCIYVETMHDSYGKSTMKDHIPLSSISNYNVETVMEQVLRTVLNDKTVTISRTEKHGQNEILERLRRLENYMSAFMMRL